MGRNKITIKKIDDARLRYLTFHKRKNGLMKKAAEFAMLCNIDLVLIFNDLSNGAIKYTSGDESLIEKLLKESSNSSTCCFS